MGEGLVRLEGPFGEFPPGDLLMFVFSRRMFFKKIMSALLPVGWLESDAPEFLSLVLDMKSCMEEKFMVNLGKKDDD